MRTFIIGAFGRPVGIEQALTLGDTASPDEVKRWPNTDYYDMKTRLSRVPDRNRYFDGDYEIEMYSEIESFKPDLLITTSTELARDSDMSERYGKRFSVLCVSRDAVRLEVDRNYAKEICAKYGVNASRSIEILSKHDIDEIYSTEKWNGHGFVIKATGDGGSYEWKDASIHTSLTSALNALHSRPEDEFPVLVEERLVGIEIAFAGFVNYTLEKPFVPFITDFESTRLCAGDIGPETPEMGIHDMAGVPDRARAEIFDKLTDWFREVKYVGWFDASCIYDPVTDKLSVFEFMTRLGSSQTENLLSMLGVRFDVMIKALIDGTVAFSDAYMKSMFRFKHAVTTVVVGAGHPLRDVYARQMVCVDSECSLRELLSGHMLGLGYRRLFRGETELFADRNLYVKGPSGRVAFATGASNFLYDAKELSRDLARRVQFRGAFYRNDIGDRYEKKYTDLVNARLLPGRVGYEFDDIRRT